MEYDIANVCKGCNFVVKISAVYISLCTISLFPLVLGTKLIVICLDWTLQVLILQG